MSTKKLQILDSVIKVDATLTQDGIPADSKVVGDAISNLNTLVGDTSVSEQINTAIDEVPKPDWTQNDSAAADYIKNRTHWIDPVDVNITLDEKSSSLTSMNTPNGTLYYRDIGIADADFNTCTITYDNTYTVVAPVVDSIYSELPKSKFFSIGPTTAVLVSSAADSVYSLDIYYTNSYYNPDITISDCGYVHQISDVYVSDTIVRHDDLQDINTSISNLNTLVGDVSVSEQINTAVSEKADNDHVQAVDHGGTGATDGATGLQNLFSAGNTVLSSYQYGDELPDAGTAGRVFFKKA